MSARGSRRGDASGSARPPVRHRAKHTADELRNRADERRGPKGHKSNDFAAAIDSLKLAKRERQNSLRAQSAAASGFMPMQSEAVFENEMMTLIQDLHGLGVGERAGEVSGERRNAGDLGNLINPLGSPTAGQTPITSFGPMQANNIYAPITINWISCMYAYKTHGVLQTAVDVPVLDALRGGLDFSCKELDGDDLNQLEKVMVSNGIYRAVRDAKIWARLFGGGALIINVEGDDYAKPLDIDRIKGKVEFYDAARWELGSEARIPKAGYYDFYGLKVHKSRVLTLVGKRAPWLLRYQLAGWGMSEYERMVEAFNGYLRTQNAIYSLMLEAKIDVFKLKGWNTQQASGVGQNAAQRRLEKANARKGYEGALVIDLDDEYQQKQVSFSGLAEMAKENRMNLAQALRMPMTKLWGISAAGFNSGEDDIENYAAMVESEVRDDLRQPLQQVVDVVAHSISGIPAKVNFSFKPLRILTALDEETIKTSKHTRFMALKQDGLISATELLDLERKEGLIPVSLGADEDAAPQNFLGKPLDVKQEIEDRQVEGFGEEGTEPAPLGFDGQTGIPDASEHSQTEKQPVERSVEQSGAGSRESRTAPMATRVLPGREEPMGADAPAGKTSSLPSNWAEHPGGVAEGAEGATAAAVRKISEMQGRERP